MVAPGHGSDMSELLIACHDITVGYGRTVVLRGVDWCIRQGDFCGLVGPNGAGKTTLLRCLVGAVKPRRGAVQQTSPANARELVCAYVPQEKASNPFFPLSVLDVVLMGRCKKLGPGKRPRRLDRQIARASLAHVGLDGLAEASFQTLSGGQKQRVLIARALAAEPHLLILDEPTSGMDIGAEKQLMLLIQRLRTQQQLTIILATHNLNLVAQYASQLAIVARGQLLVGTPDTLLTAEQLAQLYQTPMQVHDMAGRRVIL